VQFLHSDFGLPAELPCQHIGTGSMIWSARLPACVQDDYRQPNAPTDERSTEAEQLPARPDPDAERDGERETDDGLLLGVVPVVVAHTEALPRGAKRTRSRGRSLWLYRRISGASQRERVRASPFWCLGGGGLELAVSARRRDTGVTVRRKGPGAERQVPAITALSKR
jgi:hypothetical protein